MSNTKHYTIMDFLNVATCNLLAQYTVQEIDRYLDDSSLLESEYHCSADDIDGSDIICGNEEPRLAFHTMIERLLFDHVAKINAYRMERGLVSFHELQPYEQEAAYALWVKNCASKAVLDKVRACFEDELKSNSLMLTDKFVKNFRDIFAVEPTDIEAYCHYSQDDKFLDSVVNYSFNVQTGEIYKHS